MVWTCLIIIPQNHNPNVFAATAINVFAFGLQGDHGGLTWWFCFVDFDLICSAILLGQVNIRQKGMAKLAEFNIKVNKS